MPQRLESEDREPREATQHGRYERGVMSARRDRGTSIEGSRWGQAQPQARVHCRLAAPFGLLPARLRWLRSPYTKAAFTAQAAMFPAGSCSNRFPVTPVSSAQPLLNKRTSELMTTAHPLCVWVCVSVHTHTHVA